MTITNNQPCAFCGSGVGEWGNNPDPLGMVDQRVCDECNARFVIPSRVGAFTDAQIRSLRTVVAARSSRIAR